MDEDFGRVLRLAADCDPASLRIDPAEGFLLSRIDGRTTWGVLREMGGLPPEEVDLVLEGWLARGLVEIDEEKTASESERRARRRTAPPRAAAAPRDEIPSELDESALDEGLDLDVAVQRRILEFELSLRQPYHELLGVAADADARSIKRAYFRLSKEFHPDRYFRRRIGSYAGRLDRIFKKVTEAYELLSDPMARAEVERSMQAAPPAPPSAAAPPPTPDAGAAAGAPKPPPSRLERLRQRMPFRIPEKVLAERRRKAAQFFDSARVSERAGRLAEAVASVRLAIAFDPFEEEYKRAFGGIQARAAEERARRLLDETDRLEASQLKEALRLLEDVLLYRPHDPQVNDRAAVVALRLEDLEKAAEYNQRAVEHSPDVAEYHVTRARVLRARNERPQAAKALERALELDPQHLEARKMLVSLRKSFLGARAGAGGGTR